MLEPVDVRVVTRFNPLFAATVLTVGLILGAVVTKIPWHRFEPSARAAYSQTLGAELIGLRTDPYRGPADEIADFSRLDLYVSYLPLASLAW